MLRRNAIPYLAMMSLLLASCGQAKKESDLKATSVVQSNLASTSVQKLNAELDKYFTNPNINFLLAESYAKSAYASMDASDKEELKKIILNLSPEEIKSIKNAIQSKVDDKTLMANYLTNFNQESSNALVNDIYQNSIFTNASFFDSTMDLNQVVMTSLSDLRNNNINAILTEYQLAMDSTANEIATESIVKVLTDKEAADINNIQKNRSLDESQKIQKLANFLEKNNLKDRLAQGTTAYFNLINLINTDYLDKAEKIEMTSGAIILGSVFLLVKDKTEFQKAKSTVIETKKKIEAFQELIKKAKLVNESLKQDSKELVKSVGDSQKSLKKILNSTKDAALDASSESIDGGEDFPKRIKNLSKDKVNNSEDIKVFTESLKNVAEKTLKISSDVDNAIDLLNQGLAAAGIKPGKDFVKAIGVAKKANMAISTGVSVLKDFATGNYLGAASSLLKTIGGGEAFPGADMLAAMDKKLSVMDRKLDTIVELNQQMISLQKTTMTMIKDLSLAMQDFHNEEMNALAELKYGIGVIDDKLDETSERNVEPCWSSLFNLMDLNNQIGNKNYNFLKNNFQVQNHKAIDKETSQKLTSCYGALNETFERLVDTNYALETKSTNPAIFTNFMFDKSMNMATTFDAEFKSTKQNLLMFAPQSFVSWKKWKETIANTPDENYNSEDTSAQKVFDYFRKYRGQAWLDSYASPLLVLAPHFNKTSFESSLNVFADQLANGNSNLSVANSQPQLKNNLGNLINHLRLKILQEVILSGVYFLDNKEIDLKMVLTANPNNTRQDSLQWTIDHAPMFRVNLLNFRLAKLFNENPVLIEGYAKAYNHNLTALLEGKKDNKELSNFLKASLDIDTEIRIADGCAKKTDNQAGRVSKNSKNKNCSVLNFTIQLPSDGENNYHLTPFFMDLPYLEDISDVNNIQFIYSQSLRTSLQMLNDAVKEFNLLNYNLNEKSRGLAKYFIFAEAINSFNKDINSSAGN